MLTKYRSILIVLSFSVFLFSCSVELEDETSETLYYNLPSNTQFFYAKITEFDQASIVQVRVQVDGGSPQVMTTFDNIRWRRGIRVERCNSSLEYSYSVDFKASSDADTQTKRFPEFGNYVRPINSVPADCEENSAVNKTFDVNTFADLVDEQPGDGICSTSAGSIYEEGNTLVCSLRAAVMEANAYAGTDLIRVPTGRYVLTRTKPSGTEDDNIPEDQYGDLDLTDSVAIVGLAPRNVHMGNFMTTFNSSFEAGGYLRPVDNYIDKRFSDGRITKIDGNRTDRVFQIHSPSSEGDFVLLKNLAILNGRLADRQGAGILNSGNLRLKKVAIYDNRLFQGSGPGGVSTLNRGVGLANKAQLAATELALVNNWVEGITGVGGGLYTFKGGKSTINNSLIALNQARFASAVSVEASGDALPAGELNLTNVTVAMNRNTGSAIYVITNRGKSSVNFSTIAGNYGGGFSTTSSSGDFTLQNSLLAGNGANDCLGAITSNGGNFIKSATCTIAAGLTLNPDEVNPSGYINASSLVHRGGFTYVMPFTPPEEWSSRLDTTDRISNVVIPPLYDQRGKPYSRSYDATGDGVEKMDIGAYEFRGY